MRRISGNIYGPDFHFHKGSLILENGKIHTFCPASEEVPECYVIPGLVDIHFHGCMGADFCDGTMEAIETLAAWEASQGVTSICPATLTLPEAHLKKVLSLAAAFAAGKTDGLKGNGLKGNGLKEDGCKEKGLKKNRCREDGIKEEEPLLADLVGINMEGPFISHVKKGAQNGKYIRPCDADLCREFLRCSDGLVRVIGLAPEENPDFESYINEVKDLVRVSLAHTNADYETAMKAFRAGASHAVHLFNAMSEMTHREPGVPGAVADSPHVTAELICDGNHVHPAMVRAAFAMLGEERIVLISDSLRAAGLGDGEILLGGQKVIVQGTRATLAEGGNLAGSVTSLMGCLRIAVRDMGIPLESAVRCATWNPACVIGASDRCGALLPERKADLVILGPDLETINVLKEGRPLAGQSIE